MKTGPRAAARIQSKLQGEGGLAFDRKMAWPSAGRNGAGRFCMFISTGAAQGAAAAGREGNGWVGRRVTSASKNDTRQDRGRGEGRRRLGGGQEVGLGCGRNWDRIASLSDSCMHVERNKHRQLSGGPGGIVTHSSAARPAVAGRSSGAHRRRGWILEKRREGLRQVRAVGKPVDKVRYR